MPRMDAILIRGKLTEKTSLSKGGESWISKEGLS